MHREPLAGVYVSFWCAAVRVSAFTLVCEIKAFLMGSRGSLGKLMGLGVGTYFDTPGVRDLWPFVSLVTFLVNSFRWNTLPAIPMMLQKRDGVREH